MVDPDPAVAGVVDGFLQEIRRWYEGERKPNNKVNTNVMTVAMILVHQLGEHYPLEEARFLTSSQVRGMGGGKIKRILAEHGEHRPFTAEGGRTSRGTVGLARRLAELLNGAAVAEEYRRLPVERRVDVRFHLQGWLVDCVRRDYFDQRLIEADVDFNKPTRAVIAAYLGAARLREGSVAGALAQHLVGAKLSLRFPGLEISNEKHTTADKQTGRRGDFEVGDTAFHVTMSPGEGLFVNRCRANLNEGFRPFVLVPADRVSAALQLADNAGLDDRVTVVGIEDFVSVNVDEMAQYSTAEIRKKLRELLERYNERVRAMEPDPSLQVQIPANL
ncbi:DUF4928 family protein [Saccharothrix mutabilis subsp. mutabilis]|uniref:DUF4928 family protein n=1 Tax=Saccharothrix mutabilis subsp. mutabilis TaxID=66855 RepID=A0ABP3DJT8_9PSEU